MKSISIPVPDGLELPDNAQEGASFDLVTTVHVEDGMLVFESIEGVPLSSNTSEKEAESEMEDDTPAKKKGFLAAIEERFMPSES